MLHASSAESLVAPDAFSNVAISLDDAKKLFLLKKAVFVDARSRDLYGAGHMSGAINLPWESFQENMAAVSTLPGEDIIVIVYSDDESVGLSINLAFALRSMGKQNVRYLENGWKRLGRNRGLGTVGPGGPAAESPGKSGEASAR